MQLTLECRQQHEEAAGGGGIWQTTHQKTFKAEFTYTGVWSLFVVQKKKKIRWWRGRNKKGGEKKNQTLNTIVCL